MLIRNDWENSITWFALSFHNKNEEGIIEQNKFVCLIKKYFPILKFINYGYISIFLFLENSWSLWYFFLNKIDRCLGDDETRSEAAPGS